MEPTKRGKARRITLAVVLFATAVVVLLVSRHHGPANDAIGTSREAPTRGPAGFRLFARDTAEEGGDLADISGRVFVKSGGPLTNAMACAFCAGSEPDGSGSNPVCESLDSSGLYVLHRLPSGDYNVSVSADARRTRIANGHEPVLLRRKDVRLPDTELIEGGAQVSGNVYDATGGPVVGATVQATFASDDLPLGRDSMLATKSDATGAFTLWVPGGHVLLEARSEGYAEARLGAFAPARALRLVATPASQISGVVIAQIDGTPIPDARVTAHTDAFQKSATSDASGRFIVTGLRPGIYGLDASGEGWMGRHSGSVVIDISDAVRDVVVPVVAAVRVAGTIRVGEGPCRSGAAYLAPTPGQDLPNLSARADLSGQVGFLAVPPGNYRTSALCDGYGKLTGPDVSVAGASVSGLSWSFQGGASVTIRATTRDGNPVPRAWLSFAPASDTQASGTAPARPRMLQANGDGLIHLLGITEGTYEIGGPNVSTPMVVRVKGADDQEFAVALSSVGAIEVIVKDESGRENDEVAVSVLAADGGPNRGICEPKGGGRYYIGPLAAGDYHVEISDGVNPVLRADGADGAVRVRSGDVTSVRATYGGHSGRITGRVLDTAGMPMADVWVTAKPADSSTNRYDELLNVVTHAAERRTLTNDDGRFAIGGLLETAVFLIAASPALGGETHVDDVAVGQDVRVVLATPGKVSGTVLDEAGRSPAYFQVAVGNKQSTQQLVVDFGPDARGKWSIDHICPGTLDIRAQTGQGAAAVIRELAPSQSSGDIELRLQPWVTAQK